MIDYKLKVMHDKDDTLNFYTMRHNGKAYSKEENNLVFDYSMCIIDDRHMFYTIIAEKTGGAKYRINSSKTETVTNITINKITERIESNKILEDTGYEGSIFLLLSIKYIVILVYSLSTILNTPHPTSLVLCETNVRY